MTMTQSVRPARIFDAGSRFPIGSDQADDPVDGQDLGTHLSRYGDAPGLEPGELAGRIAGLTGHGGAHFPVAAKWESIRHQGGAGLVVANGAESEPLSAKDVSLLQFRPHLVLDGLALAARAVGAAETVVWLHEDCVATRRALARAQLERAARWPGRPAACIRCGPAGYLTGESSAVVRAIAGGPPLPSFRPVRGRLLDPQGRPVLVHNVETLARIALLARGIGAPTRLFTVSHRGLRAVVEANRSEPIDEVLARGGFGDPLGAVLVGGYGGRWVPAAAAARLSAADATGAGVLLPLASDECGLRCAAAIAEYLADAGARQCGPCRFGLPSIADALDELVESSRRRRTVTELRRILDQVRGRGACGHPDGVVSMVSSALDTFAEDLESHLSAGECRHAG